MNISTMFHRLELPDIRYLTNWKLVPASFLFVSLISVHIKMSATTPEALLRPAFLTCKFGIFHFLIHQLFSHLLAVIMSITIIPLVRSFNIIFTSQTHILLAVWCRCELRWVCIAVSKKKYRSEWFTTQVQNLHIFISLQYIFSGADWAVSVK